MQAQVISDTILEIGSESIFFNTAKWDLKEKDSLLLEKILNIHQVAKESWIVIKGHTDSDGGNNYNMDLSNKRCNIVMDYLLSKSLNRAKIKAEHFGEQLPVRSNSTSQGKKLNRRVEIKIFSPYSIWKISGDISSGEKALPLNEAMVVVHSKNFRDTSYTNKEGVFENISPYNEIIGIDVLAKGHLFKTQMLRSNQKNTKNISINIDKALPGKSIDLNRFFFVGDRAIILDEFTPELDNLETSLKLSSDVCIEIIGHVNEPNRPRVDSTSFEFNLSVARSKLIYDMMGERGIPVNRMCYSGKGNWAMLYPQANSSEQMKKNRRVEVVVRNCAFVQSFQNAVLDLRFDFYSRPKTN